MLRIFRNNQFFIILPLVVYILMLHLGALSGAIDPPGKVLTGGILFDNWFGWLAQYPKNSAIVAVGFVLFQSVVVNMMVDEYRIMGERNWFPGLFYALAASALPDFLFVSAPLVAASFIPFSIWNIYKAYQKPFVTAALFDSAFWLSVAGLFYPPAILLLLAGIAGVSVMRVFKIQEIFVFISGAFVPQFLGWLYFLWRDEGAAFRAQHWNKLIQFYRFDATIDEITLMKVALIAILAMVFVGGVGSLYSRKSIQTQKNVSVLYWFLTIGAVSTFVRPEWHWEHLLVAVAPMAVLLALTFHNFRNRLWADIWHLLIVTCILVIQFADYVLPFANGLLDQSIK